MFKRNSTIYYDIITLVFMLSTQYCCQNYFILYIYSTNIGTEYFKLGIYSPFVSVQNTVCFIILKYLVPALLKFYIQGVLKLKKINSGAKILREIQRYVTI